MFLNSRIKYHGFRAVSLGWLLMIHFVFIPGLDSKESFKTLHVKDLVKMISAEQPRIFDCNVNSTRLHEGVIPGATLIGSMSDYDTSKVLPSDKALPLIFYCANQMCTASHTAAERAITAGYTNVYVMVDGIYGWKKAGKATEPLKKEAYSISPKDVMELFRHKEGIVIDVREAEERHEIIEKSLWFPMSKFEDKKAWGKLKKGLAKNKTIVFYCASGTRSKKAASRLSNEGFLAAYFKGPDEWKESGFFTAPGPAK